MDAVQKCMDTLEPWLEVTEETFSVSSAAINGFIGGAVGVFGTAVATRMKKTEVKDRLKCTYCQGSGQIACGHCMDTGTWSTQGQDGEWLKSGCPNCESTGTVVCINCQGSGITVPDDVMSVLGDSEAGFTDDDYIGLCASAAGSGPPARRPPAPPPPARWAPPAIVASACRPPLSCDTRGVAISHRRARPRAVPLALHVTASATTLATSARGVPPARSLPRRPGRFDEVKFPTLTPGKGKEKEGVGTDSKS